MFFLVIGILLIAILILLLLKINIRFEYIRNHDYKKRSLSFSLLHNLIKFNIPIKKKDKKKEKLAREEQKTAMNFFEIKEKLQGIEGSYREYKSLFDNLRNYLRTRLVCKDLLFHMEFGFGEAALTGIASGFFWGFSYNILSIIDRSLVLKNQDIRIVPDFNQMKLNIRFSGIFTIRIVHIINIFFILLFSIFKIVVTQKGVHAHKGKKEPLFSNQNK